MPIHCCCCFGCSEGRRAFVRSEILDAYTNLENSAQKYSKNTFSDIFVFAFLHEVDLLCVL